jgi:dolichol-phosphate mannosyltransferase
LVGISGVGVNTALLYLLTEAVGFNHLVAAVFATESAILNNFLLNDRWTFGDAQSGTSWLRRILRYNSVTLVGLVISVAVLAGLTYLLNLHYLLANLFAIGAGTLWNYVGSSYFTWATVTISVPSADAPATPLVWARRFVASVVTGVDKLWI